MEKKDDLQAMEHIIGYHFFEPQHLIRALTHPAYANELIQKNRICLTQEAYTYSWGCCSQDQSHIVFNGKRASGKGVNNSDEGTARG